MLQQWKMYKLVGDFRSRFFFSLNFYAKDIASNLRRYTFYVSPLASIHLMQLVDTCRFGVFFFHFSYLFLFFSFFLQSNSVCEMCGCMPFWFRFFFRFIHLFAALCHCDCCVWPLLFSFLVAPSYICACHVISFYTIISSWCEYVLVIMRKVCVEAAKVWTSRIFHKHLRTCLYRLL